MIDTDCGADDAECIITCLGHLDVVGITSVAGNCAVEKSTLNVAKILELTNKSVPIFKGSERPLIEPAKLATEFHG